jgi:hypothetical protein
MPSAQTKAQRDQQRIILELEQIKQLLHVINSQLGS